MKLSKLADFWNARERRERFLLLTVLGIFILVLLGAYFINAYCSIAYLSIALEWSKDDFFYVFENVVYRDGLGSELIFFLKSIMVI